MPILLAHVFLLTAASFASSRRLCGNLIDQLISTAILFWTNIVATCLVLSAFGELHNFPWLLRGSLLLALLTLGVTRRLVPPPEPALPASPPVSLSLVLGVGATLILFLAGNIAIAATYAPTNYDSLTYHLPRTVYYLGQGSLAQFQTADFRQTFYPYNFNLLQLVAFAYQAPPQAITFFNVAAWVLAGLAVYRVARLSDHSINASLAAAWFAVTSLEILAQATSTILDLPCGAAMIASVALALRWRRTRQHRDALLAGCALSMSLGTKLTAAFFLPPFGLLLLVWAWWHWRDRAIKTFVARIGHWIVPALLSIPLGASYIYFNLQATGLVMTKGMDFTLNKPFEWGCVWHTSKVYLVQIFVDPFARLNFDIDFISAINQWFATHVFADWKTQYVFSPLYTVPPDLNEDHVFFGFAGPVMLIVACICVWRDRRLKSPGTWVAFAGLGWFVAYFAYNKWSVYNQRYFIPPFLLLAPSLATILDSGWVGPAFSRQAKRILFLAVAASAAWSCAFYLQRNTIRPVPWPNATRPHTVPQLPPLLAQRLKTQTWVNIDSYGTNERVFPIMQAGLDKRFTSGRAIEPERMHLFSFWKATRNYIYSNLEYPASYTLFPFPGKKTAGVEFLGTIEEKLADSFDYVGLLPQSAALPATPQNSNLLAIVEYSTSAADPIRLGKGLLRIVGLNPADQAIARVSTELADGSRDHLATVDHHEWAPVSVKRPFKRLVIEVLDRNSGKLLAEGDLPFTARHSDFSNTPVFSRDTIFSSELIDIAPSTAVGVVGLGAPEGPYPQWDLPMIRWAKSPSVKITVPANTKLRTLRLSLSTRLQVRDASVLEILHNGVSVQRLALAGSANWAARTVDLPAAPGVNVIELIDRSGGDVPDWNAYLDQNADVKKHLLARGENLEAGAQQHYETHGRAEGRYLPMRLGGSSSVPPPDSLYYVYRTLRIDGLSGQ